MEKKIFAVVLPEGEPVRVDKYLADVARLFSRSQLKHHVESIQLNDEPAKFSKQVNNGDRLEVVYAEEQPRQEIGPEPVPLDILYEDNFLIAVNKKQGVVVHPARGNYHGTLIQGIMHYCESLAESFPDQSIRPGIIHRLDKDTSGVVLIAKNQEALEYIARQFRKRHITKVYLALVKGTPFPLEGIIETHIVRDRIHRKRFVAADTEGKKAITGYSVLKSYGSYSFVKLVPKTGRTHQLRVHMQHRGTPVLGDPVYARKDASFPDATLLLHAYKLSVRMPETGEVKIFRAPLPQRFKDALKILAGKQ